MSQNSVVLPTTGTVSGLQMTQYTNNALDTLNTLSSGASAPASPEAGQLWHNTTLNTLNVRSLDNATWVPLGTIDETNYLWQPPVGGGSASVASASTVNLGVAQTNITITGTTAISAFSGLGAGQTKFLTFSGAVQLTYNATSMILTGGANYTTAANDQAIVTCVSTGNYRVAIVPASGRPVLARTTNTQEFYTAGTATYTPTAGMVVCRVQIVGGGGAGGTANAATGDGGAGGGGGAGGYAEEWFNVSSIGASQAVTIGAGGTSGGAGGTTSFGSLLTANGGAAGSAGLATATSTVNGGGVGGASSGYFDGQGQPGDNGMVLATLGIGGAGGSTYFGAGGQSAIAVTNGAVNGNSATGFGAGGGGGATHNTTTAATGGAGQTGYCIVTEFIL